MNIKLTGIPIKKLNIIGSNLKLKRLGPRLHSLLVFPNIRVLYIRCPYMKYHATYCNTNFYKFTGKIKKNYCYKNYKILYWNKYIKHKLNCKNISIHIKTPYAHT